MKRAIVLTLIAIMLASCFTAVPFACAEEVCYLVPEGQDVYFEYAKVDYDTYTVHLDRFVLPKGYTVKTVGTGTASKVKVVFCGLEGYVAKEDIDKMTISPAEVLLPDIAVKVDDLYIYRFSEDNKREEFAVTAETKLSYIGNYTVNGVAYYAVKKDNEEAVYYALTSHSNEAEIEAILHPDTTVIESKEPQTDGTVSEKKDKEFTWVRFVLILGIIVPLITIILMIIRPSVNKRKVHREIYDNDDDYDGIDEV